MAKTKRRSVLKLAGGAAAASMGGMAAILATGRMPAFAQQRTVHWLKWVDFVPASDALLRREMLPEAEKALGIKINLETVNGNDLQPRVTAGIQSGAGPDLIMAFNNQTYLYANSVVDLTEIAEAVGKAQGGMYKYARAVCSDGKMFMGMPWAVIGGMIAYRKSWFEEVGATKFPETWEQYREVGKKLKAKGRPIGQTLGHTFGDGDDGVAPEQCAPSARSAGRDPSPHTKRGQSRLVEGFMGNRSQSRKRRAQQDAALEDASALEPLEGFRVIHMRRTAGHATQTFAVRRTAERASKVPRERANVGAAATGDPHGERIRRTRQPLPAHDIHLDGRELDDFAAARDCIGPFTVDVLGGEGGRYLCQLAGERRNRVAERRGIGMGE